MTPSSYLSIFFTFLLLAMIALSTANPTSVPVSILPDSGTNEVGGVVPYPYWSSSFHPVNNIQIGGCCNESSSVNHQATDRLLNLTETILDLLQNQQPCSCGPGPSPLTDRPRDCAEIQASGVNDSGVYGIYPDGAGSPFFVYCDMVTDGGGWTVFQRREDGSVDFYLEWCDYKYGFGDVSSEHWLGNEKIRRLTVQKPYELRVDLEDFDHATRHASYSSFSIGNEANNYVLTVGTFVGDAGDSLTHQSGQQFTTKDRDNDNYSSNCATAYEGAWWYDACHYSNLNGLYLGGTTSHYAMGVVWYHWLGYNYSLKKSEMKIRPV